MLKVMLQRRKDIEYIFDAAGIINIFSYPRERASPWLAGVIVLSPHHIAGLQLWMFQAIVC